MFFSTLARGSGSFQVYNKGCRTRQCTRMTRNRSWRRELTYASFECFYRHTGIWLAYFISGRSHGYVITPFYCHVPGSRVHTIPILLLFLSVFNLPLFDNRGRWGNMTRKEELHCKVFFDQVPYNSLLRADFANYSYYYYYSLPTVFNLTSFNSRWGRRTVASAVCMVVRNARFRTSGKNAGCLCAEKDRLTFVTRKISWNIFKLLKCEINLNNT